MLFRSLLMSHDETTRPDAQRSVRARLFRTKSRYRIDDIRCLGGVMKSEV
jgi:hypothetical protein